VFKRYAKAGVLVVALTILVVEGYVLYQHYDLYYGHGVTSGAAAPTPAALEASTEESTVPEEAPSGENGVAFVHRATDENSRGDYTYIGDPSIDGDPHAVVLVTQTPDRGGAGAAAYDHNIGVWYEPEEQKWAIFNQDLAAVPVGATFKVVVPQAPRGFVHRATPENTFANETYLDNPLTNNSPGAALSVTQNWNPGGGVGVYNDHPITAAYDSDRDRWLISNTDAAPIKKGTAFNVGVSESGAER